MVDSILDFEQQITPYYTDKHNEYRLHVRKFNQKYIEPYAEKWMLNECHENGVEGIRRYYKEMVRYGGIHLFPWSYGKWKGCEWDPFYLIIFCQEIGFLWDNGALSMSLGPLLRYPSTDTIKEAVKEIKSGDKFLALCISELNAGSDVAQIKMKALKSADGKYYTVNGNKYWITTGHRADYFMTLVRTSNKGRFGVSLLLIPRIKGVYTSKIKLQGGNWSDTAAVTFKDVKVPVEYLIHKENQGFVPLMTNFNRERFIIAAGAVSQARICVHESIKWAKERKTFGKRLIAHQVIRHKIANMARQVLACQSLLERIAYQMKFDPYGQKDKSVVRNVSLLKVQCTKVLQEVCIEASQIFGGRSYVRGGRGAKVERIYRAVRAAAISGGSEEILLSLAMRQAKL